MPDLTYANVVGAHIVAGSVGLLLYWAAISRRKGGDAHRAAGRAFFLSLQGVALSVAPVLMLRPGLFQPAYVVQFAYLALCLFTVSMVSWTAIRWKTDPQRFRGRHFQAAGVAIFVLGGVVLAAGLAGHDPVPVVLSWVGLGYGAAMLRFAWTRRPLLPNWWLNWHLNAVCGLFTAVHGTVLYLAWRWWSGSPPDANTAAAFHVAVLAVAVLMRLWWGRRRGVPLRFTAPQRPLLQAVVRQKLELR